MPTKTVKTILALVAAVAAVVFYFFEPGKSAIFPPCPFHAFTGLYCPGCGSTRAIHQLLHGHVTAAIRLNPLLTIALPALGYEAWREIARPPVNPAHRLIWLVTLLVIIVTFGVLRNVPVYPFTLLAPC